MRVLGGVGGVGGTAGSLLTEFDTDGGGAGVVCRKIASRHFCLLSPTNRSACG